MYRAVKVEDRVRKIEKRTFDSLRREMRCKRDVHETAFVPTTVCPPLPLQGGGTARSEWWTSYLRLTLAFSLYLLVACRLSWNLDSM